MSNKTGTVAFRSYQTWYTVVGDLAASTRRPLVVLHGGPGCPHNYVLSIGDLADLKGIPVVFYDQLGCGNSTHLREKGPDFWTVELFLEELDNLLTQLGIKADYDLLGQSWGGILAAEHAVRRPSGLKHVIIANTPASMPLWLEAAAVLRSQLPQDVEATLCKHEKAGSTDSEEYKNAMNLFYAQHVCRLEPMPENVLKTFALLEEDPTVYNIMNGPSEFHVVGTLKDWTIVERVDKIAVPTLLINGKYDEAMDSTVQPFMNIPGAKWVTFQESSHMPHEEERAEYMQVVGGFLTQ